MNNEQMNQQQREQLLRSAAGGFFSTALHASLEWGVFTKLKNLSPTLDELPVMLALPPPSARVLAQILCVMGLLQRRGPRIEATPLARRFLEDAQQAADLFLYLHNPGVEEALRAFTSRLQRPDPLDWYQIRDQGHAISTPFFTHPGVQNRRIQWGMDLAAQYSFADHKTLLDIGGASGGWCIGIRKRFAHLNCVVFDLPQVTPIVDRMVTEAGEAHRIRSVSGSFFDDDLPRGCDVILLANILHDWNRTDDQRILRKAHQALPSGGVLLVSEFYFEDDWSTGVEAATQAYSVLGAGTQSGWQPDYAEMEALLREEGFIGVTRRHNLVMGRKP